MAVILISHDLGVVADTTDRIAIMYAGRIVETGPTRQVLGAPRHPYTIGLLRSIPPLDGTHRQELAAIEGAPPDLSVDITGCPFRDRCAWTIQECAEIDPPLGPGGQATATDHGLQQAASRNADNTGLCASVPV